MVLCCYVLQPQELLSLGWTDDSLYHLVPNVLEFLLLSKNVRMNSLCDKHM